jgi:hypothetical protein
VASIFKVKLATCFHVSFLLGLVFNPEDGSNMIPRNQRESNLLATCFHVGFLLGLVFNPEYGSEMFLRNIS